MRYTPPSWLPTEDEPLVYGEGARTWIPNGDERRVATEVWQDNHGFPHHTAEDDY